MVILLHFLQTLIKIENNGYMYLSALKIIMEMTINIYLEEEMEFQIENKKLFSTLYKIMIMIMRVIVPAIVRVCPK